MTRLAPFFLAAALAACAHQTSFRCEAHGGAAWSEYRSRHFVVDTDANPERAARLVDLLETLRLLDMKALVGDELEIPGRVRVVALASDFAFRDLAGNDLGGYYRLAQFGEPTIVIPISAIGNGAETLAHELSHYLSSYLFPDQPRWLNEGLAEFVQTLASRPEPLQEALTGSHMVGVSKAPRHSVGRIPENLRQWSASVSPIPMRDLLRWGGAEDRDVPGLYHASSWLLYHWLWNQRGGQLTDFQKRLMNGEAPAAAWLAAFPEYDPAHPATLTALDDELDRYRRGKGAVSYAVEGTADVSFDARPFPPAEAHMLLLSVRARWPSEPAARNSLRQDQAAEASREDPRNPLAAVYRGDPDGKPDPQALRSAAEGAPQDYRGWLLLSSAVAGAEKEAALRKAIQLNPDSARAQNELAWLLVTSDRAPEALPVANRALDLAPWNAAIVDTLAEVAARLGQCTQALQLEARAVSMRPADEGLRKRQAEVAKRCTKS